MMKAPREYLDTGDDGSEDEWDVSEDDFRVEPASVAAAAEQAANADGAAPLGRRRAPAPARYLDINDDLDDLWESDDELKHLRNMSNNPKTGAGGRSGGGGGGNKRRRANITGPGIDNDPEIVIHERPSNAGLLLPLHVASEPLRHLPMIETS